jgi:hypothetical protein
MCKQTNLFGKQIEKNPNQPPASTGKKDDLKALLESVGEKLPTDSDEQDFSASIPETYELIVECKDEADQKRIFDKLTSEGYKLRILTL